MKNLILALLVGWWSMGMARAQAPVPSWQMATILPPGKTGFSVVDATATDAAGNVYVMGSFSDSLQVGNTLVTSTSRYGFFVAKWLPTTQAFAWVQSVSCSRHNTARGLAVGTNGVYVCGMMDTTTTFGTITLPITGQASAFVAKLADAGTSATFQWVERMGGNGFDGANTLVATGTAVYVTGFFTGSSQFGTHTLQAIGSQDAFLAKIVDNGPTRTVAWAVATGGSDSETGTALTVNGPLVYLGGSFSGTPVAGSTAVTRGISDLLVARYTDTGTTARLDWTQQTGGPNADSVHGLAVSGPNVYVIGNFNLHANSPVPIATFFGTAMVAATPDGSAFVAKIADLGTSGRFVWANVFGSNIFDFAMSIAASGPTIVVSGYYTSARLLFPNGTSLVNQSTAIGSFVTKLTDQGTTATLNWATQAASQRGSAFNTVAFAPNGTLYVGGRAGVPVQFGPIAIPALPGQWFTGGVLASLGNVVLATSPALAPVAPALYPNPAHGSVTIDIGTTPTILTLFDAVGRTVLTKTATGLRTTLPLMGLPAGVYAVRLSTGDSSTVQRLVVE